MYKKFIFPVIVAILFSGCGSKEVKIYSVVGSDNSKRNLIATQDDSHTMASTINNTNINLFQAATEETLKSGYSNFRINEGTMENIRTASDFINQCANKSSIVNAAADMVTMNVYTSTMSDPCGLFFNPFFGDGDASGMLLMSNNNEGFNAKDVLKDLKDMGYYRSLKIERFY